MVTQLVSGMALKLFCSGPSLGLSVEKKKLNNPHARVAKASLASLSVSVSLSFCVSPLNLWN